MKTVNVAIIGHKFMGKAHSNAWANVNKFFDAPLRPVLKVACGRDEKGTREFADTWGWEGVATDWRKVIDRSDVDIIDISTPTDLHAEIAIAAAHAGKHIFCEKPVAVSYAQAKQMYEAAEKAGVVHYLNHNYRRVPAISFAKKLIDEGKIGTIYHWRGAYLQDWIMDPNFPLTWHLQKKHAGAGPHFDLGSHSVDLARYLVGDIAEVTAMTSRFIEKRPLPGAGAGTFAAGVAGKESGEVTVEDAAFMVAKFENGTLGSFETSRFAAGRKNYNNFEIYGSKGSIAFNTERMNELQYLSLEGDGDEQGFRTIMVTNASHPYVGAWWPPGHIIGYEHEFHHAVLDFLKAVDSKGKVEPNLLDGMREMQVLEAALQSAETGKAVKVSDIR